MSVQSSTVRVRLYCALADAFSFACCSFSTFFTIFCSSTRKARTMRSRTAPPLSTPPYARFTVFLLCDMRLLLY